MGGRGPYQSSGIFLVTGGEGNFEELVKLSDLYSYEIEKVEPQKYRDISVSSTKIRSLIMDSLKVKQQDDGQYVLEWDKEDPQWKWLNRLTPEQLKCIVEEAIRQDKRGQL